MRMARVQIASDILRKLEQALQGLAYGSIQLVVHDSQIVRVERLERIRLTGSLEAEPFTNGRPTAATEARHETVREA